MHEEKSILPAILMIAMKKIDLIVFIVLKFWVEIILFSATGQMIVVRLLNSITHLLTENCLKGLKNILISAN